MNILFISSWYPTKKNPNLGIFVKEHAQAIHTAGNNIVVLSLVINNSNKLFDYSVTTYIDSVGVKTIIIQVNSWLRDLMFYLVPLQYIFIKRYYNKYLRTEFEPDIVHSNVIYPAGIIGYWLSNYINKPHIITEHWTKVRHFSRLPILSIWGKRAYQNANKIIPVSQYLQSVISDCFNINEINKFRVVGNVISADIFNYEQKQPLPTEIKLCAIASWTNMRNPAKQPELLIEAVSVLQKYMPQKISITMIGGGDKVPELKKLSKVLNVNVNFPGYLSKVEIAHNLKNSDFFVHPTTIETFGVVVVEAIMTGTPVVCSDVSALKEIVNSTNGVLCVNTVDGWVTGLKLAFENSYDTNLAAANLKKQFSGEAVGKALTDIYFEISNK